MSSTTVLLCLMASVTYPLYEGRLLALPAQAAAHLTPFGGRDAKLNATTQLRVMKATHSVTNSQWPSDKEEEKKSNKEEDEKTHVEKALETTQDALGTVAKTMVLGPIAAMRGELCLARDDIISHSDCMDWLVEECTSGSFGTGLCTRVKAHVKEECQRNCEGDKEKCQRNKQACDYAKRLGIDVKMDSDSDGVDDEHDAQPHNPSETKDTDGDGVGDNADDYPNDPLCTKKPCIKPVAAQAPAPAASPAPAPANQEAAAVKEPAKEEAKKEEKKEEAKKEEKTPAKEEPAAKEAEKSAGKYEDPSAKDGLASQGFSGKKVIHEDGKTATSDWGDEYGHPPAQPRKSGAQSVAVHPLMHAALATMVWFCAA